MNTRTARPGGARSRVTRPGLAAAAILVAGSCLLFLSACQQLFGGPFSGVVAQQTAMADLSGVISASAAPTFNLSILKSGGGEFVLLYSSAGFDGGQAHLLVLSPDLKVLDAYTMNDILALSPVGSPMTGTSAVTHLVDGTIVIGDVTAMPSNGKLLLLNKLSPPNTPVNVQLQGSTIVGPSTASRTWTAFGAGSGSISWTVYASDWSSATTMSQQLGQAMQLGGVFTDPEDQGHNAAVLVFSDGSTTRFVQVPKDPDLVNGLPGPPLLDNPAYPQFSKPGLDYTDIHVTADSIIGYENGSRSWARFTTSDPGNETLLYSPKKSGQKTEFSFSGGYFCTWDPGSRSITRAEKWW